MRIVEGMSSPTPPQTQPDRKPRPWMRFSLRGILIVTAIMALSATGLAHLIQADNGGLDEIASLILITNVAPLGLMVAISWFHMLVGYLKRPRL